MYLPSPPVCVATTKDAIYFAYIPTGLRRSDRFLTLAKSVQSPGSGTLGSSWTTISTTVNPDILTANRGAQPYSDDTECHVDVNGVFTMFFYRSNDGTNIRFDPTFKTPLKSGANTTYDTLGHWSIANLHQPSDLANNMQLLLQPEDNLSTNTTYGSGGVTVYYQPRNKATFQYAHINSDKFNINIADRDIRQGHLVCGTSRPCRSKKCRSWS